MLKCVLLDVGGTLWPDILAAPTGQDPSLARLAALLPELEPAETLRSLRLALAEDQSSLAQSTHVVLARTLRAMRRAPPGVDPVVIRRALCQPASAGVQLFPGAVELLAHIRQLGLRCVILSNVQVRGAVEYWRDFADLGIAQHVDDIVTSLEVGFRKPHAAMFDAGLRAAGGDAASCVMVGNSEVKDVQPAVALGMRAIRVAIEEPLPDASAAHAVADNLPAVARILQRWATT